MKRLVIKVLSVVAFLMSGGLIQGQSLVQKDIPADYGYLVKPGQQVPEFEMTLTDGKR